MRKLFWVLIILVIILTVAMIIVGIVAQLRLAGTTTAPVTGVTETTTTPPTPPQETLASATVVIQNFSFNPQIIHIKKGQIAAWINRDSVEHTVTLDDNSQATPLISPGQSASLVFNQTGTFTYHCTPHSWMKGTVVVTD